MRETTLDAIARSHADKCSEAMALLQMAKPHQRDAFINRLIESIDPTRPLWMLTIDDLLAMLQRP